MSHIKKKKSFYVIHFELVKGQWGSGGDINKSGLDREIKSLTF